MQTDSPKKNYKDIKEVAEILRKMLEGTNATRDTLELRGNRINFKYR